MKLHIICKRLNFRHEQKKPHKFPGTFENKEEGAESFRNNVEKRSLMKSNAEANEQEACNCYTTLEKAEAILNKIQFNQ